MSAIVGFDQLNFISLSFLQIYEAQQDPETCSGEDDEPDDGGIQPLYLPASYILK
jgi:hypothetical protein